MNKVLSEVYFNRSLIWLALARLDSGNDTMKWMYLAFAVITFLGSLVTALDE